MAGPNATVLFSTKAVPLWRSTLDEIIGSVGPRGVDDYFWVETTLPIGGAYIGEKRPFLVNLARREESPQLNGYWDEEVKLTETPALFYSRNFGMVPDEGIQLSAMINNIIDHRILAEVALRLAERLNGIIDLHGLLTPSYEDYEIGQWPVVQPDVEGFTASVTGKAVAIPYNVNTKRIWAWHVVDMEFMRAWLRHPQFEMIK